MSYDQDYRHRRPLLVDITARRPVYRRHGLIAALAATVAAWSARRQLARITRWYRHRRADAEVPEHLREDVGLPPRPQRLINWWEFRP